MILIQTDIPANMCTALFVVTVSSVLALSSVQAIMKQSEFGPKLKEFVAPLHTACVTKTGIDEALIDRVINGEFIEEPIMKSYMTCLLLEGTLIDEKGEPNLELVETLIPEKIKDESLKNIKSCYVAQRDVKELEEKIFKVFKCYYELNPNIFIFF